MAAIKDINPAAGPDPEAQLKAGMAENANPGLEGGIPEGTQPPEGQVMQGRKDVSDKVGADPMAAFNPQPTQAPAADPMAAFNPQPAPGPSAEPGAINPSPANYEDRMAAGSELRKNIAALSARRGEIDPEVAKQAGAAWDAVAGGFADSHSDDFWKRLMAPLKMGLGAFSAANMPFTVPYAKIGQAVEKATGGLLTEDNMNTALWGMRPIGGLHPLVEAGGGDTARLLTDPETGAMKGGVVGTFPPQPKDFQNAAANVVASLPEKITSAAMRDGEHIAMGTNHSEAAQALDNAGHNGFGGERGYTTTQRAFVSEEEAQGIAKGQGQTAVEAPKAEDITMHNPAEAHANAEANLLHAWNEGGVHPSEVAADLPGNSALARDLSAARSPPLPLPPRPDPKYIQEFDDTLNRLRGAHAADQSEFLNLTRSMPESLMNPGTQGEWYKHAEGDPTGNMSPADGEAYNKYMLPLKQEEARLFEEVSKSQLDLGQGDYDPEYMHRMVKGKSPEADRLTGAGGEADNPIYNGPGLLSRKASSMHARKYFVAENEAGERRVVSINGNELRTVGKQEPGNDLSYSKPNEMDPKKPGEDLRKGDQFKDSEGDNWTIKNAYTREIEAATDHKYYQNALANTIDNIMHLRAASRAIHAIEQLRATPEWSAYTEHTGHGPGAGIGDNGGPPMIEEPVDKSNWKYPQMPLFRNDLMDPKLANLLDDFWGNREADGVANTLMKINDAAIGSMFLTPFPHTHNAAVHFLLQRSWDNFTPSGLKSLAVNGGRAMAEVWNQGPIYQELQRRGSGLLYGKIANRDFYADMLERTGTTLAPEETSAIEKIMGWGPGGLVQSLAYASAKGLWLSSDIMTVTRVMEEMNTHGLTMDAAIAKTERFMPNYRIPSEMLGSRAVQQTVMSRLTFMFQRYHYGMLKGIANMVNDTFRGTAEQKMHVAGSMLSAGILMMVMYPAVNDLLKKLTGTDLHIGPAGPLRLAEPLVSAGVKATSSLWSKETKDYYKDSPGFLGALSNTLSAAPVSKTLIETGLNRYNFSGRNVVEPADLAHGRTRRIIGQTAEHLAQNAVAPYSILRNITKNGESAASALTKFTFGLSEHTNDAEMRKQKALNWQERSANRRATKGGLGPIEKFFGDK